MQYLFSDDKAQMKSGILLLAYEIERILAVRNFCV